MDEYEALRLENQLCFPLYAAARRVVGMYTPVLKPLGITYTQYVIFMVLWERDGIPVGELCEKLYLDTGTLTPVLKRLEDQGFLARARSATDERVVIVTLTEKGMELREKAKSIPKKMAGCVKLSPDEAKLLYGLLYKLIERED